jgi:hypothetical protein
MDRQQAVAEPEQRDEDATEWAHREFNAMLIAVTQTDTPQAMLLVDGRDTLSSFPTSINTRDTSQSTSWATFQLYQQRAGFAGCNHGQGPGLPEEVQQELAEAELRHTVARWEILEKAKAFSPSSHPRIEAASCMDPVTGSAITDYSRKSSPSNALMHSHQLFNHDPMPNNGGSIQGFNLGVWPTQQVPDTTFVLNPSQNDVHDSDQMSITFPNIHVDDPSAPYQAMYREPSTEISMLPRTPPFNMISPLTIPPRNGNIASRQGHPCVAMSPGLSPYPTIEQSATGCADAVENAAPLLHSQTMTVISGIGGDQLSIAKRKTCCSNNAGYDKTASSCALDNIYFHTSPDADRERKKDQPKRRKVTTKASWSCFGCRLNKRKVRQLMFNKLFLA